MPGPLPWADEADLQAQGLRDSEYSRLHLNIWTQSEDRLVSAADLAAAVMLDGEQEPRAGVSYLISVDLGLVNDKTVVAVGHLEPISPEPGALKRVVIDSLRRWRGKRTRPVQIGEIEIHLALTAKRYNNAKVLCDPWQASYLIQRLPAQGVRCEAFEPRTTLSKCAVPSAQPTRVARLPRVSDGNRGSRRTKTVCSTAGSREPWTPWSPIPDTVRAPPGQAQTLQMLKEYEQRDSWQSWAFQDRRS